MIPTLNQNSKQHVNPAGKKVVSIAMQGGGAHGAFSWGVLDKLLEDALAATPAYMTLVRAKSRGMSNAKV